MQGVATGGAVRAGLQIDGSGPGGAMSGALGGVQSWMMAVIQVGAPLQSPPPHTAVPCAHLCACRLGEP